MRFFKRGIDKMLKDSERVQISLLARRVAEAIDAAQATGLPMSDCVLIALSAASDCGRNGGLTEARLESFFRGCSAWPCVKVQ
jgi:hypothetical protein